MMSQIKNLRLIKLRKEIDLIDEKLVLLIAERMRVVERIGLFKKEHHLTPLDAKRWKKVVTSKRKLAISCGLDPNLIQTIFNQMHAQALAIESQI